MIYFRCFTITFYGSTWQINVTSTWILMVLFMCSELFIQFTTAKYSNLAQVQSECCQLEIRHDVLTKKFYFIAFFNILHFITKSVGSIAIKNFINSFTVS